jgi:phage/plasmid-like protein (TIGR03299 family)
MSILDDVLDNTTTGNGARILSEQHDTGKITIDPGSVDSAMRMLTRGGAWDAAEYGITQEQAARMIAEADTPEARARVMLDLVNRALKRAGLDTSNGRVNAAFARKPAWHGLGVVLDREMTWEEAITHAGQDWEADKLQLSYKFGDMDKMAEAWGVVRRDTGAYLGTVGSRYQPIQNKEGFAFLDSVIDEYGAHYESAGSIYGGKKVWMLANMPRQRFSVNGNDVQEPYVLFQNCHDGSGAAWCYPTMVRVECANTLRTSGKEKSKGLSIRHTGDIKGKIASARNALGFAVKGFEKYKESAEELVRKPMEIRHYASDVLDAVLEISQITAADAAKGADVLAAAIATTEAERKLAEKSFEKKIERREEILGDILERYESERCNPRGTAWGCYNAVSEFADHGKIGKQSQDKVTRDSRRFESVLSGDRDELKQAAFAQALAL